MFKRRKLDTANEQQNNAVPKVKFHLNYRDSIQLISQNKKLFYTFYSETGLNNEVIFSLDYSELHRILQATQQTNKRFLQRYIYGFLGFNRGLLLYCKGVSR